MSATPPAPTGLRVDGRTDDPTIPATPHFGWRVDDPDWGDEQTAYRVRVARSPDGPLVWDSGRVESADSTDVSYDGPALDSDARYWWTVRVWNDDGERSARSDPASFRTAPETPWAGDWIGPDGDTNGFRTRFEDPDDAPWVAVDVGEQTPISEIALHPTEPFGGPETPDGKTLTAQDTEETYRDTTVAQGPVAFGFPDTYRVEVADDADFADAETVVEADGADVRRDPAEHEVEAVGRYVRVVATDPDVVGGDDDRLREERRDWSVLALAALEVRDGSGADAARGRPVTPSSSVESEAWGATHLTNGVTESRFGEGSPRLRREVTLSKRVASAHVHVAALGYGELYLNGEKVGDSVLDPGWTDYTERVLYRTYDVTDHLSAGENALGLWLGRGWFAKPVRQWPAVGAPRATLRLTVEYADGTTRTVTTGPDWRLGPSPVTENDIYDGESYDARREEPGWATPGFDDGHWESTPVVTAPDGELYPQQTPPIRVTERREPVEVTARDGGHVVDFGQNLTGWVELTVRGADAGDELTVSHAEALNDDGSLQTVDLRTAEATDTYVARGDDAETYAPRFTYHGFRYARIEGYPGDLDPADVTAEVVHTDFDDTGRFACADADLNAVQENARWGLRSNAHSVPTDCPQRDERQGFTGDGHLAGGALHYNFGAGRFHEKFARDHADAQSAHGYVPSKMPHGSQPAMTDPTWTYSLLDVPWRTYCHDADARSLRALYPRFARYVAYYRDVGDPLLPERFSSYGDWVALENADGRVGKPVDLFTNAYHYRALDVAARVADALGTDDAERYRAAAEEVAAAFVERYFDADAGSFGDTQAANAVPLALGLVPEDREADVAEALVARVRAADGHLQTGFLGTPALLRALTESGHADVAYEVASTPEKPGWVYQVRQGATTVWERWDTDERVGSRMNSRNHSPFALVSEWFYEGVAGLECSSALPRERRVDVRPGRISALDWAEAAVETPHGEVATRWERDGDALDVSVTVPWNLTAAVHLPDDAVTVNGDAPSDASAVHEVTEGGATLHLGPGEHAIRAGTDTQ
ncbi:MAG: family 78 glycoside hydrolase catalytic domain [Halobacteriaceae archaeon]